jgi:hypothetical protein
MYSVLNENDWYSTSRTRISLFFLSSLDADNPIVATKGWFIPVYTSDSMLIDAWFSFFRAFLSLTSLSRSH